MLLGLVLAEVCVRVGLGLFGDGYHAAEVEAEVANLVREMGASEVDDIDGADAAPNDDEHAFPHPYFGYETNIGFGAIDEQYAILRSERYRALPLSQRPYVVLIVGGSVAQIFGGRGRGGVERLRTLLLADPAARQAIGGRELWFMNQGRPAFKEPQQLMLVAYLLNLGFEPEVVVNIDGFNEAAFGVQNADYGVHPAHPSAHHAGHLDASGRGGLVERELALSAWDLARRARRFYARAQGLGLFRSSLTGLFVRTRVRLMRAAWSSANQAHAEHLRTLAEPGSKGPRFTADDDEVSSIVVDSWERASRSLAALCEAHGAAYLHVLQPTLFDLGSKPLTAGEEAFLETTPDTEPAARGVRLVYPRLRERGAHLAAEGFAFLDASLVFEQTEDELYYDFCHFVRAGNDILAEAIAPALAAELARAR